MRLMFVGVVFLLVFVVEQCGAQRCTLASCELDVVAKRIITRCTDSERYSKPFFVAFCFYVFLFTAVEKSCSISSAPSFPPTGQHSERESETNYFLHLLF